MTILNPTRNMILKLTDLMQIAVQVPTRKLLITGLYSAFTTFWVSKLAPTAAGDQGRQSYVTSAKRPDRLWGSNSLLLNEHQGSFKRVKLPGSTGRDSAVGIATRYGPGIESRRGRDFPHPSRPTLGPTQPPVQWEPGLSPGVKPPGRGADHPPPI